MSPRSIALLILLGTICSALGAVAVPPGAPWWAKFGLAGLASVGAAILVSIPALKHLDDGTGGSASGGPGLTLGGKTSNPSPPPAASQASSLPGLLAGIFVIGGALAMPASVADRFYAVLDAPGATEVALVGCNVPAKTVVNDFSPAGQCLFSAALSGKVDFTQPATAVLQLLAICTGATVSDVITLIEQVTGNADAGLVGGSANAPTASQLVALYAEAKKLPPTFGHDDAVKALGARK